MNNDSISAVISISPQASITRYVIQSFFIFSLSLCCCAAILFEFGNKDLWMMVLVICITQMLGLPLFDIVSLIKTQKPRENL